jgi:hypothetical protein
MPRLITSEVAGVRYGDRQYTIRELVLDQALWLCREPTNPADPNAIVVLNQLEEDLGYLPRDLAARFAPILDAVNDRWPAWVAAVLAGQEDSIWGVLIRFEEPTFAEVEEAVPA